MRILEVGPRDGLQNESKILSMKEKEALILSLFSSGIQEVELGSFVKASAIPQLAGTRELVKKILPIKKRKWPKATLWAFAPNEKGVELAQEVGVEAFSFFAATSETFAQKNIRKNHKELKSLLKNLAKMLPAKTPTRAYLSTLVYCPFEGAIAPKKVFHWIDFLLEQGFKDISLSDTTGHAHPANLKVIFEHIAKNYNLKNFSLHYHDTRGTALLNTYYAMTYGFKQFDASLGGAGGCPYAPGATGNLATEDLLYLLQSLGHCKDISLKKVGTASINLEKVLGRKLPSRYLQTMR